MPPLDILRAEGAIEEYVPEISALKGANRFGPLFTVRSLKELGEQPLLRIAGDADVVRCVYVPSLITLRVVGRLGHGPRGTLQYTQETNGCRSGPPFVVGRREERAVGDAEWSSIEQCLEASRFDTTDIAAYDDMYITDGSGWLLEAVRKGRHHAVYMHSPPLRRDDGGPTPLVCCDELLGFTRSIVHSVEQWPKGDGGQLR